MAGIYIHIPFCKTKCNYCDFYKETDTSKAQVFTAALLKEIEFRKGFLENEVIDTVYFGGGTPSLLNVGAYKEIFDSIYDKFTVSDIPEITIEANPDDCDISFLNALKTHTPINRISLGVQSFYEKDLVLMGRRHNARQAETAIGRVLQSGFENLGIDLIYGLPDQNTAAWENNLKKAFSFNIQHLSAYHLTYEPDTVFYDWKQKGRIRSVTEESSIAFLEALMHYAQKAGFEHYEISNFAKPGKYSKHNTAYWKQVSYLGLGPSAHSFNGKIRSWNVRDLSAYITCVNKNTAFSESEEIDTTTAFNEFIMLGLRTKQGVDVKKTESYFGTSWLTYLLETAKKYIEQGKLLLENGHLQVNREHIMITDAIISDLFFVE